jgi:hypothetical protein
MTPDALAADTGILTIEQAAADLDAAEVGREVEAPSADKLTERERDENRENTEAEPAAEGASEPEAVTDGDDAETEDGTEEAAAELPAIEPPRFWDAEAKKRFGELPRDLQELVLTKETDRDKATAKAIEEAALRRKAADGEASRIAQLNGVLDKLLPQAQETFKDRWENVDWDAVVDQRGPIETLKLKNQMETERAQIQQLKFAKDQAEAATTQRFVAERFEHLKTACPDLADEKEGPDRQLKLVNFLTEQGVPAEAVIKRASAAELSIAYDAMRWRQAQASAKEQASAPKTQAQPKPAMPAKPSVKPTAAPARNGSPQSAKLRALESAFDKNPSKANLEALLDAQGT